MKKLGAMLTGAAAIAMFTAVTAWACTNLATLNLSESAVTPGQSIEVTGSSFRTADKGGQDVAFRWNGVDGPVLASATTDASGQVVASVTVPTDAQPGFYTLVATQNVAEQDGHLEAGGLSPAFGTPARAAVQVGDPVVTEPVTPVGTQAADSGSTSLVLLAGVLALGGIGLFAGGLSLFMRESRSRPIPQAVRSRQE